MLGEEETGEKFQGPRRWVLGNIGDRRDRRDSDKTGKQTPAGLDGVVEPTPNLLLARLGGKMPIMPDWAVDKHPLLVVLHLVAGNAGVLCWRIGRIKFGLL